MGGGGGFDNRGFLFCWVDICIWDEGPEVC